MQGVGFSACLPVMGSITSHWSTTAQTGIFMAILSSFLQIAPIFTMPLSAELCVSEWGWPSIYYIHGVISIILFIVFIFYHRNSPNKHPLMKRQELVKVCLRVGRK
jgi:MFS family permease